MTKILFALFSNALILCANITTGVLLARFLGPDDRGLFATAVSMTLLVGNITSWSVNDLMARHLSDRNGQVFNACGAHVILVTLGTAMGLILLGSIGWASLFLLPGAAALVVSGLLLIVPLMHISLVIMGVLQGTRRWIRWNLSRIAPHVAYLLLLLALPDEMRDMQEIAWCLILSYAASCLVGWISICGLPVSRERVSVAETLQIARISLNVHASRVLQIGRLHMDRILIPLFFSTELLGYYIVAMTFVMPIYAGATTINSIFIPRIAREITGPLKKRRRTFIEILALIALFVVTCSIYVLFSQRLVVIFFGQDFTPAEPLLGATTLIILGYSISKILEAYFVALNRTRLLLVSEMFPLLSVLFGLVIFQDYFQGFLYMVATGAWCVVLIYIFYLSKLIRREKFASKE